MKKFFATVLCLLMLAAVPMAVSAAAEYTELYDGYCLSSEELVLGENQIVVSDAYEATLFEFTPGEYAEYTITADDSNAVVGAYAGTINYIHPGAVGTDSDVTIAFSAGSDIIISVRNVESCTLTIEKSGAVETKKEQVEWNVYENTAEVELFETEIDPSTLLNVDTYYDDLANTAVLGADGYYHLDNEESSIIYVDLNDKKMSFVDIVDNTKLSAVFYDADGNVSEKHDYTNAVIEYINSAAQIETADSTVYLYPLTADLIEMYQVVGLANDWYGDDGWVGGSADDAWMFACYYDIDGYVAPSIEDVMNPVAVETGSSIVAAELLAVVMIMSAGVVVVLRKKLAK